MKRSVQWRASLSDGNFVQVVAEPGTPTKFVEIVTPYGSSLETGGGEECARFAVLTEGDRELLLTAIEEAATSNGLPDRK